MFKKIILSLAVLVILYVVGVFTPFLILSDHIWKTSLQKCRIERQASEKSRLPPIGSSMDKVPQASFNAFYRLVTQQGNV
jgi:hypothetical protein